MTENTEVSVSEKKKFTRRGVIQSAGLVGIAFAAMPLLSACGTKEAVVAVGKGSKTLRLGISGDPAMLDPAKGQQEIANTIMKNTYAQWTDYKEIDLGGGKLKSDTTAVIGDALESMVIEADGVTMRCKVRDFKFPSGNNVTADDFIYTIERTLELKVGSIFVLNVIGITKLSQVTKVNDMEFTVTLPAPSPIVGGMLHDQTIGLIDSVALKSVAGASDPWGEKYLTTNSLGGGAYNLKEFVTGSKVVLEANPEYHREAPFFDNVTMQIIPDPNTRALLLESGEIDVATGISLAAVSRLIGKENIDVIQIPSRLQNFMGLINNRAPFNNKKLRQAVAAALPYEKFSNETLYGLATTPTGVWPTEAPAAVKQANNPYVTDIAKCKTLLAEGGKPEGFTFNCELSTADDDAKTMAIVVQSALAEVNITMNIKELAPAIYQANLNAKTGQSWIQTNLVDYVDDPYYHLFLWFTSKSVLNWFAYSSSELDGVAKKLSTELDESTRSTLAIEAQKILNDDVPVIVLAEPKFVLAIRSDITGVLAEPDALLRLRKLVRQ